MKLIYSLQIGRNKNRNGDFCGYRNSEELLDSLLLSATISGKHFDKCELYCDSEALQLIKEDRRKFPFDKIHVVFDELNKWVMQHNWAYSKIYAESLQTEPFVHLDVDAFLHHKLPAQILSKKFLFQGTENTFTYPYYTKVFNEGMRLGILPSEIRYKPIYAYNCGIAGCLTIECLPLVKKHFELATEYIKQQQAINDKCSQDICYPLLFEQLFIANIILDAGIEKDVALLITDDWRLTYPKLYTHLLTGAKRNQINVDRIKKQLKIRGLIRDSK
jgi:hypothetical protein